MGNDCTSRCKHTEIKQQNTPSRENKKAASQPKIKLSHQGEIKPKFQIRMPLSP